MLFQRFRLQKSAVSSSLYCHIDQPQALGASKNSKRWLGHRWFSHCRIGQKIALGYVFAFSLATGGAIAGLLVGNGYHARAEQTFAAVAQEGDHLDDLYSLVSQAHVHQLELISLLQTPAEFQSEHAHFLKLIAETNAQFINLQAEATQSHQTAVTTLIATYQTKIEVYFAPAQTRC